MYLEQLAKQGCKKAHTTLAGRNYNDVVTKRKAIMQCFANLRDEVGRNEFVAKIKDIVFINDAKSINPNSTWFVMEGIGSKIIWIVEAEEVGEEFLSLIPIVREKVGTIISFGDMKSEFTRIFNGLVDNVFEVRNMKEAVSLSNAIGEEGDVVLFSPGNGDGDYSEIKGELFKSCVNEL